MPPSLQRTAHRTKGHILSAFGKHNTVCCATALIRLFLDIKKPCRGNGIIPQTPHKVKYFFNTQCKIQLLSICFTHAQRDIFTLWQMRYNLRLLYDINLLYRICKATISHAKRISRNKVTYCKSSQRFISMIQTWFVSFMISTALIYFKGTVNLFEQHHSEQLVWKGHF